MNERLQKCVNLAPHVNTVGGGAGPPESDAARPDVQEMMKETRTQWIRLWADWADLMPKPPKGTSWESFKQGVEAQGRFGPLDSDIAWSRYRGLRVILVTYRFPRWANGTGTVSKDADGNPRVNPYLDSQWQDTRLGQRIRNTWRERGPAPRALQTVAEYKAEYAPDDDPQELKDWEFCFPSEDQLGWGSPWCWWIRYLALRYHPANPDPKLRYRTIQALEVCNEPDLQCWPLRQTTGVDVPADGQLPSEAWNPTTPITAHRKVARMFETAQHVNNYIAHISPKYKSYLKLLGPATSDRHVRPPFPEQPEKDIRRRRLDFIEFTDALLTEIQKPSSDFQVRRAQAPRARDGTRLAQWFAWSHHNYVDITPDGHASVRVRTGLDHGAQEVRRKLKEKGFKGFPSADAADPQLFITEGGVLLVRPNEWAFDPDLEPDLQERFDNAAARIKAAWIRVKDDPADSEGILMFSQFLLYSVRHYDSGIMWRPAFKKEETDRGARWPGSRTKREREGLKRKPIYGTWVGLDPPPKLIPKPTPT
jgi:hypothetical protein